MEKKNNINTILLTVLIALIAVFAGYYFGNKNSKNVTTNNNQTANNGVEKECECPEATTTPESNSGKTVVDNTKSYMHVFTYLNDFKGYNLYSFLNNQGEKLQVIDYKGDLYYIYEYNTDSCFFDLSEGKAKFKNDTYTCSNDEEIENSSGSITKLNIKSSEVKAVRIINSCRSDGAPYIHVVYNDGKVNKIAFIDSKDVDKNIFKDYKVKDITDFKCTGQQEAGYKYSVYSLLLEDGTTVEVKK